MKRQDANFFRQILRQRMRDLFSEASKAVGSEGETKFPDPTDRASLEADRSFILRMRDRERKLILKIEGALKRLDEGVYGICEECGGEIGTARLKARPVTTLCIDCKSNQEVEEKRQRRLV